MPKSFTTIILAWFEDGARPLPWKNTKDPYVIWISEIILQQTRVNQGTPYFVRFIEKFPTVYSLAAASEDEVMKFWEGLGYYSRARNLHFSAKYIVHKLGGKFPDTYKSLLELKGIGPYTAAAIASFAFDLPHAVVDGNVYRIMTRYYGIKESIDDVKVKKEISHRAAQLIPEERAADFNQAMMDFGATVCTPEKPLCFSCPLQESCIAFHKNLVKILPIKSKKATRKERHIHYVLVKNDHHIFIKKRQNGIWKGLYELPVIELKDGGCIQKFNNLEVTFIDKREHLLTHQKLHLYFYKQTINADNVFDQYICVRKDAWEKYSYPKPIQKFLTEKLFNNF